MHLKSNFATEPSGLLLWSRLELRRLAMLGGTLAPLLLAALLA